MDFMNKVSSVLRPTEISQILEDKKFGSVTVSLVISIVWIIGTIELKGGSISATVLRGLPGKI